jgi:hypothetical protein
MSLPRPRNWRKIRSFTILGFTALLLIVKFQNCAPAPGGGSSASSSSKPSDGAGVVTTIDDINADLSVSFNLQAIKAHSDAESVSITGKCAVDQDGSVLGWRLLDDINEELGHGYATCEQGTFKIEVAPMQDLTCGRAYQVVAHLGGKDSSSLMLERDCSSQVSN